MLFLGKKYNYKKDGNVKMKVTQNFVEQVLELINSGNISFIDNHVRHEVCEETIEGYVILDTGKICPVYMNNTCSLNPLYIQDDGKMHLSTWSTGNIISTRGFLSLEDAVENYNNICGEYGDKIIDFKLL